MFICLLLGSSLIMSFTSTMSSIVPSNLPCLNQSKSLNSLAPTTSQVKKVQAGKILKLCRVAVANQPTFLVALVRLDRHIRERSEVFFGRSLSTCAQVIFIRWSIWLCPVQKTRADTHKLGCTPQNRSWMASWLPTQSHRNNLDHALWHTATIRSRSEQHREWRGDQRPDLGECQASSVQLPVRRSLLLDCKIFGMTSDSGTDSCRLVAIETHCTYLGCLQ